MTGRQPTGVGIIGAGNISTQYLDNLTRFPDVEVRFIADAIPERAAAQAQKYGVPASGSAAAVAAGAASVFFFGSPTSTPSCCCTFTKNSGVRSPTGTS